EKIQGRLALHGDRPTAPRSWIERVAQPPSAMRKRISPVFFNKRPGELVYGTRPRMRNTYHFDEDKKSSISLKDARTQPRAAVPQFQHVQRSSSRYRLQFHRERSQGQDGPYHWWCPPSWTRDGAGCRSRWRASSVHLPELASASR